MGVVHSAGKRNLAFVDLDCLGPLGEEDVQLVLFEQQGEKYRGNRQIF